jgi:hypothetical protein
MIEAHSFLVGRGLELATNRLDRIVDLHPPGCSPGWVIEGSVEVDAEDRLVA